MSCVLVYLLLCNQHHRLAHFWRPGSPKVWNLIRAFVLLYHVAKGKLGGTGQCLLRNLSCDHDIKIIRKGGALKTFHLALVGLFLR